MKGAQKGLPERVQMLGVSKSTAHTTNLQVAVSKGFSANHQKGDFMVCFSVVSCQGGCLLRFRGWTDFSGIAACVQIWQFGGLVLNARFRLEGGWCTWLVGHGGQAANGLP